jgi:hypothetical protein
MNITSTKASVTIERDRERFFYWFMSINPPDFLHSYIIIPGVVEVRNQSGPMHIPGSARELVLSDGTSTREEILTSDPPKSIHYRITDLTNIFRYLVKEGKASFAFTELTTGETQIDWQYAFVGHNSIAAIILKPLVSTFWRGFMQSALTKVKQLAEGDLVAS